MDDGWVESRDDWFVPIKVLDLSQAVGQTLQIVTSQELLVSEEVNLTPKVRRQVEVRAADPEWVLVLEVEVERVQANVLGEVGQLLFAVVVVAHVPSAVVGVYDNVVDTTLVILDDNAVLDTSCKKCDI